MKAGIVIFFLCIGNCLTSAEKKVCLGTKNHFSVTSDLKVHHRLLQRRFQNCTHVEGNLEITWIKDENLDLTFLEEITEVTGYVLIFKVDVPKLAIPNLRIIRGRNLFTFNKIEEQFSLVINSNKLSLLKLTALQEISRGNVGIYFNPNLCHLHTVNWKDLISQNKKVFKESMAQECECHENCKGACWGTGPEDCQKLTKVDCHKFCGDNRCFEGAKEECCHSGCAGGCTGPSSRDCNFCKYYDNNGECDVKCPPLQIYNPLNYSWVKNPAGKYSYGFSCIDECPKNLFIENDGCVKSCGVDKIPVDRYCVPCKGENCPKVCKSTAIINSSNIKHFKDCVIIEGFVRILATSLDGYTEFYNNFTKKATHSPMHPEELEIFNSVKEITGYLEVEASHEDFKSLKYFRNLEIIDGQTLYDFKSALYVVKTSLVALDLSSLKLIREGAVVVIENADLCVDEQIDWGKLNGNMFDNVIRKNKSPNDCIGV